MAVESKKINLNKYMQDESKFTPSHNISVDDSQCENRLGKKKDFGYEVCDIKILINICVIFKHVVPNECVISFSIDFMVSTRLKFFIHRYHS